MAKELQARGGKILLWRLGPLSYKKQDMWDRAPTATGMWAFPWPYMDSFLNYHQYTRLMPKRLKTHRGFPLHREWYKNEAGETLPTHPSFDEEGRPVLPEDFEQVAGLYEAQEEWVQKVGKRVLPLRKFWYEGYLYSHISRNGEVGDPGTFFSSATDWHKLSVEEFVKAVKKSRGDRYMPDRSEPVYFNALKTTVDHLEVYLPQGEGKFS